MTEFVAHKVWTNRSSNDNHLPQLISQQWTRSVGAGGERGVVVVGGVGEGHKDDGCGDG